MYQIHQTEQCWSVWHLYLALEPLQTLFRSELEDHGKENIPGLADTTANRKNVTPDSIVSLNSMSLIS